MWKVKIGHNPECSLQSRFVILVLCELYDLYASSIFISLVDQLGLLRNNEDKNEAARGSFLRNVEAEVACT
jgi:hypothetical protein